jgi:hypothetical protein
MAAVMSATAVEAGSAAAGASLAGRGEDVMEQKGLPNALFLIAACACLAWFCRQFDSYFWGVLPVFACFVCPCAPETGSRGIFQDKKCLKSLLDKRKQL